MLLPGRHSTLLDSTDSFTEHHKFKTAEPAQRGRMGDIEELDLAYSHYDVGKQTGRQFMETLLQHNACSVRQPDVLERGGIE